MKVDDWFTSRPSGPELDAAITTTQARLDVLLALKQLESGNVVVTAHHRTNGNGNGNGHAQATLEGDQPKVINPARLSDERRVILQAMLRCPGRTAGPTLVQKKLQAPDVKPIQTNLGRMARYGLVERVRKGKYRVPDHVADLVRDGAEG